MAHARQMRAEGIASVSWDPGTGRLTSIVLGDRPLSQVEDDDEPDPVRRKPRSRGGLIEDLGGGQ